MARGPYQGTWNPGVRPTVVHSPDVIVYINGEADILGCGQCRKRFDFNRFITSVQVDLNIDSPPGSASISMSIPRHSVDDFYFDGNPLVTPMMEIEIFAKGYYLIEGIPQYYPIFWGMVTEVSDSYSGGEHTFSINCADILKWWELCQMNINPAMTHAAGQSGRNIFGNVFFGANPFDIIWTLAQQSFGDVVVGSGSLVSLYKENNQKETFSRSLSDIMIYWQERFGKIRNNLLMYGTRGNAVRGDALHARFVRQGGQKTVNKKSNKNAWASQVVRQANGGKEGSQMVYDPTDRNVTAFRTQFMQAGQVNFFQSEYQTKLELANAAKEAIGYEFYMDVTGEIIFKPPFYNLDVLSNKPVSWIQDIDIIDWDLSESEAEVFTQVQIQGGFGGNVDYGFSEDVTPFTSVTDYHLLRKYGWRTTTYNSEFLGSPLLMFYVGLDVLDRLNAKRFRGTINIPLRPELRLGFPIYLGPKDQIWYVAGISHNIAFGGRAQTTVTLTAKRSKFIAPRGIGAIELTSYKGEPLENDDLTEGVSTTQELSIRQLSKGGTFKVTVGSAAQIPATNAPTSPGDENPYEPFVLRHPKTGRIVGFPNAVMAYTRPFFSPPDEILDKTSGRGKGRGGGNMPSGVKDLNKNQDALAQASVAIQDARKNSKNASTATEESAFRDKHFTNRYTYGLNSAGVYTYLHDKSELLDEIIFLPANKIEVDDSIFDEVTAGARDMAKEAKKFQSGMIRPVSDERGFEVIGHYKYGRGIALRDGSLIPERGGKNSRANIHTQIALAGGLTEMLQAQSSGIGTITSSYPNPAAAIATLRPEDLQTAAVFTPEGGIDDGFSGTTGGATGLGDTFIDVAPLGSPENVGLPTSVEASQFSKALTLAEMAAKEEVQTNKECLCLLGRADINFINVGYQVKVLRGASGDNTQISLGSTGVDLEESRRIQDQIREVNEKYDNNIEVEGARLLSELEGTLEQIRQDELLGGPDTSADFYETKRQEAQQTTQQEGLEFGEDNQEAREAEIEALEAELEELEVAQGDAGEHAEALREGKPIADSVIAMTREEVATKVNSFLVGLYSALDDGHQELESALRGDTFTKQNPTAIPPDVVRFGPGFGQDGFAPPFGAMGRARGGDPEALGLMGQTARDDVVKEWGEFSDELKAAPKRKQLESEIGRLEKKIMDLLEEKEGIQNDTSVDIGVSTSSTSTSGGSSGFIQAGDGHSRCAAIEKEVAKLSKMLDKARHDLAVLNQEHPPP